MKRHLPHITHGMLEKGIRKGWVKVDRQKLPANTHVHVGQVIEIADSLAVAPEKSAIRQSQSYTIFERDTEWMKNAILYEDADMIILNKPAGIPVQAGSGQRVSIDRVMKFLYPQQPPKLVHRLDRDTSGVLVMAKTAKAAAVLSKQFASRQVEKTYLGLVVGVPKPRAGSINIPLGKAISGKDSGMEKMEIDDDAGKKAYTEYEVVESFANKFAWVEMKPITGRTHQLRVHMASIQHPIVGDGKYGGAEAFVRGGGIPEKLHLHALRITLPRAGKKPLTVEAPLPEHMERSKKLL